MATVTRNRTSRKPQPRHLNISKPVNGCYAIGLTIGEGEKAKHYHYFLEPMAADFGLAFRFVKYANEIEEGEPSEYHVNIDIHGNNHSCECKGFLRHGMNCGKNRSADEQRGCKHVAALLSLLQSGRIAVPQATQQPVMVNAEEPIASVLLGGERHRQEMATRVVNDSCCMCDKPYADCTCTI